MHFDKIRMRAPKATLEAGYLNPFSFCFRFSEKKISLACEFRGGWASGRKNHLKSRAMQTRGSACHKDGSSKGRLPKICAHRAVSQTANTNVCPADWRGFFDCGRREAFPYLPFAPDFPCLLAFLQAGQRTGSFSKPFSLKKSCSPFENTNSLPQSRQTSILSLICSFCIFRPSLLLIA